MNSIARDRQYAVQFDNVAVSGDSDPYGPLIDEPDGAAAFKRTLDRAAALHCAHSLGGAQHVLEMTVEYTKQRVQFGRAIATFQAVQHTCADMVIAIDSARLATYEAITRIEDGQSADKEIALAKTLTNHAFKWTTLAAQQVHGGIGFMEEYDLQLWTRRAKVAELKFGPILRLRRDVRTADGADLAPDPQGSRSSQTPESEAVKVPSLLGLMKIFNSAPRFITILPRSCPVGIVSQSTPPPPD